MDKSCYVALPKSGGAGGGQALKPVIAAPSSGTRLYQEEFMGGGGGVEEGYMVTITKVTDAPAAPVKVNATSGESAGGPADKSMYMPVPK